MRVSVENCCFLCLLPAWQWLCKWRNSNHSSRYLTSKHTLPICLLKKLLSWIFSFPDCLSSVFPAFWSSQRMQISSLISFNADILSVNRRLLASLIIWKAGKQMWQLERWPETLTGSQCSTGKTTEQFNFSPMNFPYSLLRRKPPTQFVDSKLLSRKRQHSTGHLLDLLFKTLYYQQ